MPCYKPIAMKNHPKTGEKINSVVPCGNCIGCLNEKRNQWTFRLLEQQKISYRSFFTTLTYDESKIPPDGKLNVGTLQSFFKRIRKYHNTLGKYKEVANLRPIKYFAVGEYGDKFGRPHYHAIIFNAYKSAIETSWKNGFVRCDPVTQASIHYVTKYSLKPNENIMVCSNGLGETYITDESKNYHLDLLEMNGEVYLTYPGGRKQTMPRYYKERIFSPEQCKEYGKQVRKEIINELPDCPEMYHEIKEWKRKTKNKQFILTKKLKLKR